MNDFDLDIIKKDLRFQLEFEDIDWQYFIETATRALNVDERHKMAFGIDHAQCNDIIAYRLSEAEK